MADQSAGGDDGHVRCAGGYGVGGRERQQARATGNRIGGERGRDSARKVAYAQRIATIQAIGRRQRDRACAVRPAIHGQAGWIRRQGEVRRRCIPGNGINVTSAGPGGAGRKPKAQPLQWRCGG